MNNNIFITGGTGYIGSRLIPLLIKKTFNVTALVRENSKFKNSLNCITVTGDALDNKSYIYLVKGNDTFIHLVGVSRPGPGKSEAFRNIDLVSIEQAVKAAITNEVKHFIYLSVAYPAPVMKDFIEVRMKGEELLQESGINCSFIRPWYVLGPGHYWPYLILPFYKLAELFPSLKPTAIRLSPVKLNQILNCILHASMNPPSGINIHDVPSIKNFSSNL